MSTEVILYFCGGLQERAQTNLLEILKLIAYDKLRNRSMVSEVVGANRYVAFFTITSKSRSISISHWRVTKQEHFS